MAGLMHATGLEKGGIYRHFASEEEVAAAAFDFAWQAATDVRMHDLDSIANSVEKLKRFIANFIEGCRPWQEAARCLTRQSIQTTATPSFVNVPAKPCLSGRIFSRKSSAPAQTEGN